MAGFDISIPAGIWVETQTEAIYWLNKFLSTHKQNGGLGLDTETTGKDHNMNDLVIVWSLSDGKDRICLPAKFLEVFKEPLLENPEINFDMSNACFDAHRLANTGIDISKAGEWRDTTVMSWLINENNEGRHGLKECIEDHFGRKTPTFSQVFGTIPRPTKANPIKLTVGDLIRNAFNDPVKKIAAVDYSALDSYNSTALRKEKLDPLLRKEGLYEHYYNIEVPFTKVLWRMERRGITTDYGYLQELKGPMEKGMQKIEAEFAKEAGKLVNLNSPAQVRSFFIEHLQKPVTKMTKGGKTGVKLPSTDEEVLNKWAEEGDVWAQRLLLHRGTSKIYGTYVEGLSSRLDIYYRLHTTFNQHGTVTGRLSSTNPNLQNIPRPSEDEYKIRDAFVPSAGMILIVADYAQLEMRLMAHFSKDEKMINAIRNGIDLHCFTVAEMNEGTVTYDEVVAAVKAEKKHKKGQLGRELTPRELLLLLMRQDAKATGFGIIYGIGGRKLAAQLSKTPPGMPERILSSQEGDQLIEKWFKVFPRVKEYIEYVHHCMSIDGYVKTILGRKRRFGDVKGMAFKDRNRAERQGVNSIIQGTAADLAKVAMILADTDPVLTGLGARLLLQVHDELVWECPDNEETIKQVKDRVKQIMEHPLSMEFEVPLPVEAGHGYSWASAK